MCDTLPPLEEFDAVRFRQESARLRWLAPPDLPEVLEVEAQLAEDRLTLGRW